MAGISLAHFFDENQINFKIIDAIDFSLINENNVSTQYLDNNHPFQSASFISTGIINPVTGRRFVKSWMIDELLPFAENFYINIGKKLNSTFVKAMPILRFFQDKTSENDFDLRLNDENYKQFFTTEKYEPKGYTIKENSVLFTKSLKVDVFKFIKKSVTYFKEKGNFTNSFFNIDEVGEQQNFDKIIFCEGYKAQQNKYFNFIPFTSQRGQLLEIENENLDNKVSVKKQIQITPKTNKTFTVSTTWDWNVLQPIPTIEAKQKLESKFTKLTNSAYKIINQKAAIRPTVKDRRPVIGFAKENDKLLIFNGLGSKGTSIAPFFANELLQLLTKNKPILKEVEVCRFY